ncbi:hypothetical protein LOZ53_005091 [Ophidiomyces ophidiicola]|nr:hypothetical protein LOZ53_005091 [Ophidiomyces ophidiicola]
MYGSQPPPQAYHPTAPPPTQPEWQQKRPAKSSQTWQGASVSSTAPSLPPPAVSQPTAPAYSPSMYGPMPSVASPAPENTSHGQGGMNSSLPNDTLTWGVRYNQQYGHHQSGSIQGIHSLSPPPLPPRPTSGVDHQFQPRPGQQQMWASTPPPQPYYTQNSPVNYNNEQQQQFWQPHLYPDPGSSNQSIPPIPPPVPPAYQAEAQQHSQHSWPSAPVISTHPPTHNYEPSQQNLPQQPQQNQTPSQIISPTLQQPPFAQTGAFSGPNAHYTFPNTIAPERPSSLPPPEPPIVQQPTTNETMPSTTAYVSTPTSVPSLPAVTQPSNSIPNSSALGLGAPSDWEHLSTNPGEIDDTASFKFKPLNPPQQKQTLDIVSDIMPTQAQPGTPKPILQPARSSTPVSHDIPQSDHVSPVSSEANTTQHVSRPFQQTDRMNSVDSYSSAISVEDGLGIESVIKQWSQPTMAENKSPVDMGENPVIPAVVPQEKSNRATTPVSSLLPSPIRTSPKQTPPAAPRSSSTKPAMAIQDPYADLDPWYKSSLARYVAMLRKEMATESDEGKFKLFSAFMAKESKLREILYSVEILPETPKSKPVVAEPAKQVEPLKEVDRPTLRPLDTDLPIPVDQEDDVVTYSPGGRPVFGSSLVRDKLERTNDAGLQRSASNPNPPAQVRNRLDASNTLGLVGSPVVTGNPLMNLPRATSVPPATQLSIATPELPRAYTPFRYQEAPTVRSPSLDLSRPAYQAYSALRQASAESGRAMAQPTLQPRQDSDTLDVPRPVREEHSETFLGLVREKSVAYRGKRPETNVGNRSPTDPFKKGIATAILDDIRGLVPAVLPDPSAHTQVVTVRKELQKFSDDFSFMEKSLEAWDRGASARQAQLESVRRTRQEESERHIDSLFNSKEIGYSDISVLENEFKQVEAQKQLNEERKEFDKFVEIVFVRVDERLGSEIESLESLYKETLELLDPESGDSKDKLEKFHLSYVMKNAADIFQKLEKRHDKRVCATIERERRRKRAERRFFVFMGDSAALKQMDKDFEAVEKRVVLDAAKRRDERANQLMDSLDDASMRGIGENQTLLDDIAMKVEKLDPSLVRSINNLPAHSEATLTSATKFVQFLGRDSESILSSFGIADRVLNNADYEVSVSEARVANAGADIFRRLEEEKKKEDGKIEEDLESRMADVRSGHEEILQSIKDVLDQMQKAGLFSGSCDDGDGESGGGGGGGGGGEGPTIPDGTPLVEAIPTRPSPRSSSPMAETVEQQDRLRKALEEAKKRNAAKQG